MRYIKNGFTLIELMLTLAIVVVISSLAVSAYRGYIKAANISVAIHQIRGISFVLNAYESENGQYPDSLIEVENDELLDPWDNEYEYYNISSSRGVGASRKDHNTNPINTKFDLYSKGEDGRSATALTAAHSRDDVVYANDGGFLGLAEDY